MKKTTALTLLFFTLACIAYAQPIQPFQPNARWGGRTVAIAVHPVFENELIAASATGGLFKSTDGGNNWRHLDNCPVFTMMDVKYNPMFHDAVIATSLVDTDTTHKIGIWLSFDRGETWSQLDVPFPVPARDRSNYNSRLSGYGISFDMNGVAYVGTDYGVAVGKTSHRRWEFMLFDNSVPVAPDKLQQAVFSVNAFNSGKMLIGTRSGVYYCRDAYLRSGFRKSSTDISFWDGVTHGISRSPYNEKDFLITPNETDLLSTADTGRFFISRPSPPFDRTSRMPVVAMVKSPGRPDYVDIYVHKVKLFRKTCHRDELNIMAKAWEQLNLQHDDMSGYAIVRDELKYITGDGGIFKKSGDSWNSIGHGRGGYQALQIYQVWGQKIADPSAISTGTPGTPGTIVTPGSSGTVFTGRPQIDYYFGTQDNDIWMSRNGGDAWGHFLGVEGSGFDGPRVVSNAVSRNLVYVDNSAGVNRYCDAGYLMKYTWPDPGKPSGNPKYAGNGAYLQIYIDTLNGDIRVMQRRWGTFTRWEKLATIQGYNLWQGEKASTGEAFTMYFPYSRALASVTPTVPNIGLIRLQKKINPDRTVSYDLTSMDTVSTMGSLMIYGADFSWPTVYGFDHNNPNKLLAPDVMNKVMKWSTDGGLSWQSDINLTNLITERGRYSFFDSPTNFQVWTVSFNPDDSRQIIIGTKDAGLLYTSDGGSRWCRIPGSKLIPNITSAWWDFDGTVLVSSYGRGLWKFKPGNFTPAGADCSVTIFAHSAFNVFRKVGDLPFIFNQAGNRIDTAEKYIPPVITLPAAGMNNIPVAGIISTTMRNGQMVVGDDGRVIVTGSGFSAKGIVYIEFKGKMIAAKVPVSKSGTIRYPIIFNQSPGIYQLFVIQELNGKRTRTPLQLKVPLTDK
ncbi:MAG TPA: hypothetical protein PLO99_09040 [Chitinophagaceae bacterium]|nr:hypothetical protein [Chitinophagaceae bacterium]